jgi:hypothetical protein
MIEDTQLGSSCISNTIATTSPLKESQKELEVKDILNSDMMNSIKDTFGATKIVVKGKS